MANLDLEESFYIPTEQLLKEDSNKDHEMILGGKSQMTESVYELHYLKTKWFKDELIHNPYVLNDKLQLENISEADGNRILKHLTAGLRAEGLAIKEEVHQISEKKLNDKTITIEDFSETAIKMYHSILNEGFDTQEQFQELLENVFVKKTEKFASMLENGYEKNKQKFLLSLPFICFKIFTNGNWFNLRIVEAINGQQFFSQI